MPIEVYSNFNPKIAQHIDERLKSVANFAALPDPTLPTNFIYEGALAYVKDESAYYRAELISNILTWKLYDASALVLGEISITSATTVLDLSLCPTPIEQCYGVKISIISGSTATIQAITNLPNGQLLTLFVKEAQILNIKHFDYDVATNNQVVLENGFDMAIRGRIIGNESLTIKKHGIAVCQWDAVQFMKSSEWLQNLLNISVVDNLTTDSATSALSAKQGKILDEKKQNKLVAGEKITLTDIPNSQTIVDSLPRDWYAFKTDSHFTSYTNLIDFPTAIGDYLTSSVVNNTTLSLNAITSIENRYVDLRDQSTGNWGLWLLPANKVKTSFNNWICLEQPKRIYHTRFNISAINDFSAFLDDDNCYRVLISSNNYVGSSPTKLGLGFESSISNRKQYFYFTQDGLYTVNLNLVLNINRMADTLKYFRGRIIVTNGIADNSSLNITAAATNTNFIPTMSGQDRQVSLNLNTTFKSTNPETLGFFFVVEELIDGTWSYITTPATTGTLQITKYE